MTTCTRETASQPLCKTTITKKVHEIMLNRNSVKVHMFFLEIILWNVPFAGSSQKWSHKVNFDLMLWFKWNFMFAIVWTFLSGILSLITLLMIHNSQKEQLGSLSPHSTFRISFYTKMAVALQCKGICVSSMKILVLSEYWFSFYAALIICQYCFTWWKAAHYLNTLRTRQNGRHFPDDIFKCIFLN